MTQHAQGRLDYDIDSTIIYSGNVEIAKMFNPQMSNDGWRTAVSNARRLVACWNACEGMSTDALEASTVLSVLTYQRAEWNLERDELLAQKADELKQLQEQNTYLDKVASELQDTCDKQAKKLAQQEAAMRQALDALKNSNAVSYNDLYAIKALEDALK